MKALRLGVALVLAILSIAAATPALGLANRVFVSARSGNNANSCDNILTPCQTFAGAVVQLNAGGEAIVLDSGGYGPVTITQSVTIEAPAGVTAFIHPASGDAVTVNAPGATVTLRGLVLNGGTNDGIVVQAVGTLTVENCNIAGFTSQGIHMAVAGNLNVKNTDVKFCYSGIFVGNSSGISHISIDRCHLDNNTQGLFTQTTDPGASITIATNSTANQNSDRGWLCGYGTSGDDVVMLESCTGSENGRSGVANHSANASSYVAFSNCTFVKNVTCGIEVSLSGYVLSRGNNTLLGAQCGPIGTISPV